VGRALLSGDLRVALVDDDVRYRASLELLFAYTSGFVVAASCGTAAELLAAAEAVADRPRVERWDVVLLDVDLPGTNGIEAVRQLKERLPDVQVVMLTVFEEPTTMVQAICAGADGYLLKRASARELLEQVRLAAGEGAPLSAPVARRILDHLRRVGGGELASASRPTRIELSTREREVLRGLVDGRSYQQVADALAVHIDTVRTHIRHLYRKLRVHSAAEAVARAVREQLV
jgi:DNA-binding NarL/FixJ family response regulator